MRKLRTLAIIGGAALLTGATFTLQWSEKSASLSVDSAEARIGQPGTALSVAGVHRRAYRRAVRRTVYGAGVAAAVGYGLGGYYGGYGYPAYSYSAPYATNYGAGYGYGSYYGGNGYPGYSTAPYNPGPSFGFGWRY